METLEHYANKNRIIGLLIKERVKCCRKNLGQHDFSIHHELSAEEQSTRKFLSTIMPPRATWERPRNRDKFVQADKKNDTKKINAKSLQLTIKRDRKDVNGNHPYLARLDRYVEHLRHSLLSGEITFKTPELIPLHKDTKYFEDKHRRLTFRPLSVYSFLDDKIILSLVSHYIMQKFDNYLHTNILSYRGARKFDGEKRRVPDFNDGIKLIGKFRVEHENQSIYAFDCDIRKFYDTVNHDVVRNCFSKMFSDKCVSEENSRQLMSVLDAYLNSFNFCENVMKPSLEEGFWKRAYHHHRPLENDECRFHWISDADGAMIYGSAEAFEKEKKHIGIPQGGSLSLIIADFVLNDVDKTAALCDETDGNRLFVRFCDDMIFLHTDFEKCTDLKYAYAKSLTLHKLAYHPFTDIEKCEDRRDATCRSFWSNKSHNPFLWGDGEGNSNRYVGFLGYEMSRDGVVRLRRSNELKFDDKLSRFYYCVYRNVENKGKRVVKVKTLIDRFEKSMTYLVGSINFYEGLKMFNHSEKQLNRMSRHRRIKLRRIIARLRNKKRPIPTEYESKDIELICQSLEVLKSIGKGYRIEKKNKEDNAIKKSG